MTLTAGVRLGPFEVVGPLGAGGMGEVYRARDTKLGREVALKVLPDALASDPERRARFEREARTLAALNHPNIAAIHGFEEADGISALVLELVEGPTLADRIAAGPIPLADALPIARQIAEALEAPHEQGIVHRDLKPANIKLRPDGTVKVLDFGLAKLVEPDRAGPLSELNALSPTFTAPAMSQVGVILGTAAYMAPEQARGRVVDKRADIWAFGCVLYEMLAGKAPFGGDDVSQILARVIERDVEWTALPASVPPALRALLRRCLQKDPRQRLRDIGDVRLALEDAAGVGEITTAAPVAPSRSLRTHVTWAAVSLALAAATGVALWMLTRPAVSTPVRVAIPMPDGVTVGANSLDPAFDLSEDGRRLVFVSDGNPPRLFVRSLDQLEPRQIAVSDRPRGPFLSPDGSWIGYFDASDVALKKVPIGGGPPVALSKVVSAAGATGGGPRGATWAPDNTIIFATNAPGSGLLRVSADGGEPEVLTKPDDSAGEADHYWPSILPGGQAVLFTIVTAGGSPDNTARDLANAQIAVLDLRTRSHKVLVRGGSHARYAPSGHIVYGTAGSLRAVAFDVDTLDLRGVPFSVLEGVLTGSAGAAGFDIDAHGTLTYLEGPTEIGGADRELVWVDRQGREEPISAPRRAYMGVRISPDGSRIAVNTRDQDDDIWIWHTTRATLTRLTFTPEPEGPPRWTPDGLSVVFSRGVHLFQRLADGTGGETQLLSTAGDGNLDSYQPLQFSPDGSRLIIREPKSGHSDLAILAMNGERRVQPLIASPAQELSATLSPDGRWIAYDSNESGDYEVYVRPFPDVDRGRWQVSTNGGQTPVWSRNGRELFFLGQLPYRMMAVPIEPGATFNYGSPQVLFETRPGFAAGTRTYDVAPDGQRFLMALGPDARSTARSRIVLVQNWLDELKRLAARQ